MNHLLLKYKLQFLSGCLFIFLATAIFIFSNHALLSEIEPYDFGNHFNNITKNWGPDIALFVAQKFVSENGIEQRVSVSKLTAGSRNNFIYLVFIDNQIKFVIKGLYSRDEASMLSDLQHSTKIRKAENNMGAAKVCLTKLVQSYKATDDNNQIYYFAILEAAQGNQLFKIMTNELLNTKDINNLKDIFFDTGRQISELHKSIVGSDEFVSPRSIITMIHDDLHQENIFYDPETKKVSLIDNETMGESIHNPLPIYRELYGLYEIPIIRWPTEKNNIDLLKDADPHDIAAIYIELVKGMASVYQNSKDATAVFIDKMIELNNKAIAYLKDNPEFWMFFPSDRSETHIVSGKLSRSDINRELNNLYQSKLTIINNDLRNYLFS